MLTLLKILRPLLLPFFLLSPRTRLTVAATEDEEDEATEREIQAFIDVGQAAGILEGEEGQLVESLVDFFDTVVREVMTPRTDMVAVEEETGFDELLATFAETHKSRVPVYRETIDSIVGEEIKLLEYTVQAITEGMDALGKVTTRIQAEIPTNGGDKTIIRQFMGRGADTDILTASAKAYLFAINRMLAAKQHARSRREAAEEDLQRSLDEMHATHGSAHVNDYWGIGVMREEDLK